MPIKLESQVEQNSSKSPEETFDLFMRANAQLHSLSSMIAGESKLALSDLVACEHLRLDGPLTAKEVAYRVQMGSGATTAILDRLEKRGLVRRAPHPTDRRSVLVHYLGGGEPGEPQLVRFLALLRDRVDQLAPSERVTVAAFLQGVASDIEDALRVPTSR